MRKCLLLAIYIVLVVNSPAQTRKQSIDTKIEKVTVFLQGAQVQRTAKTTVGTGKTELVFNNISPSIDQQSIQVKAEGKLTVLSVIHQHNYLKEIEMREELAVIDQQKAALSEKLANEKNLLAVFTQEESLILKNQAIKGEQATLKSVELRDAADFQRQRLTEIYTRRTEIDKAIRKIDQEIEKLNKQLRALNERKDLSTSDIIVTVSAKEASAASFTITYLVKNAGWYPTYDIRVKDALSPINLFYKANINQNSGEDWKEVKLQLSTGNPTEDGTKPVLNPWYLRYISPTAYNSMSTQYLAGNSNKAFGKVIDQDGKPVAYASVSVKGTSGGTVTNMQGEFSVPINSPNATLVISAVGMETLETKPLNSYVIAKMAYSIKQLKEVVVTGYGAGLVKDYAEEDRSNKVKKSESSINTTTLYQPTTTVYDIEEPYSIPNDGKQYMVEIIQYELPAIYQYYAAPKINLNAFLTARILNWQELNLLPGESNLFLEGNFLGKSFLDTYNAGDTLELSLGMDKGVQVKRTMVKEYSQKRFLANNRVDNRKFEIVVRNNKNYAINITIEDQFPISTTKEIEINDKESQDGKVDADSQKISWQQTVDAKKEIKLNYGYSVKYPKDKRLQLD